MASFVALAQDKPGTNAKADSIIKKAPTEIIGHTAYDYSINGKMQTSENIKARLYAYAPSKVELLKSSKETSWLGVSIMGFGISGVGATLEFIDKNGSATHYSLSGAYVLSGVATAFVFSTIFHSIKAKKHANKAFAAYNQQYQL
ncbi:hypothetical protein [Mucilaginibacter sp.]